MIQYIARGKKNPRTQEVKYYAQMAPTTPITFKGVAEQIEKMCTVTDADIKAVLMSLETVVTNAMKNGTTVRLGEIGSFRPTLSSKPVATADKVDASCIKRVRCRYTQGGNITKALLTQNIEFQPYKTLSDSSDDTSSASA